MANSAVNKRANDASHPTDASPGLVLRNGLSDHFHRGFLHADLQEPVAGLCHALERRSGLSGTELNDFKGHAKTVIERLTTLQARSYAILVDTVNKLHSTPREGDSRNTAEASRLSKQLSQWDSKATILWHTQLQYATESVHALNSIGVDVWRHLDRLYKQLLHFVGGFAGYLKKWARWARSDDSGTPHPCANTPSHQRSYDLGTVRDVLKPGKLEDQLRNPTVHNYLHNAVYMLYTACAAYQAKDSQQIPDASDSQLQLAIDLIVTAHMKDALQAIALELIMLGASVEKITAAFTSKELLHPPAKTMHDLVRSVESELKSIELVASFQDVQTLWLALAGAYESLETEVKRAYGPTSAQVQPKWIVSTGRWEWDLRRAFLTEHLPLWLVAGAPGQAALFRTSASATTIGDTYKWFAYATGSEQVAGHLLIRPFMDLCDLMTGNTGNLPTSRRFAWLMVALSRIAKERDFQPQQPWMVFRLHGTLKNVAVQVEEREKTWRLGTGHLSKGEESMQHCVQTIDAIWDQYTRQHASSDLQWLWHSTKNALGSLNRKDSFEQRAHAIRAHGRHTAWLNEPSAPAPEAESTDDRYIFECLRQIHHDLQSQGLTLAKHLDDLRTLSNHLAYFASALRSKALPCLERYRHTTGTSNAQTPKTIQQNLRRARTWYAGLCIPHTSNKTFLEAEAKSLAVNDSKLVAVLENANKAEPSISRADDITALRKCPTSMQTAAMFLMAVLCHYTVDSSLLGEHAAHKDWVLKALGEKLTNGTHYDFEGLPKTLAAQKLVRSQAQRAEQDEDDAGPSSSGKGKGKTRARD